MDKEAETVINKLLANKKLADDLINFLTNENWKLREDLRKIRSGIGDPKHNLLPHEIAQASLQRKETK